MIVTEIKGVRIDDVGCTLILHHQILTRSLVCMQFYNTFVHAILCSTLILHHQSLTRSFIGACNSNTFVKVHIW